MFNHKYLSDSLKMGERPLQKAPVVTLPNGNDCTPQQFFEFDHTLNSVEGLISNIKFSTQYPIFVSCDNAGVFLQVGVIGYDNYQSSPTLQPKKIVYGRKWRVESNLPTSEIIQTAFLAIKKAREHELREFVRLFDSETGKTSTPFNNHHDLPLMASNHELFEVNGIEQLNSKEGLSEKRVQSLLKKLLVGNREVTLMEVTHRVHNSLVDLTLSEPGIDRYHGQSSELSEFSELNNCHLTLVMRKMTVNELLHEVMAELIKISDQFVEEHFLYDGFARFSRQQDIISIGQFSIKTRHIEDQNFNEDSKEVFRQHNGMIDASRAPVIYNESQRKRLEDALI